MTGFLDYTKAIGEFSEDHVSPRGFKVGDRVRLHADWEDGPPDEVGVVTFVPPQHGRLNDNMIVVTVDVTSGPDDDGLREVSDDQAEKEVRS